MYPNEPARRSLQQDDAPNDWSYVHTVEEGLRQRQAKNIGEQNKEARTRHRAMPSDPQTENTPAVGRAVSPTITEDSPFVLPETAPRRAAENAARAAAAVEAVQPAGAAAAGEAVQPAVEAAAGEAVQPAGAAAAGEAVQPAGAAAAGEAVQPAGAAAAGEAVQPAGAAAAGEAVQPAGATAAGEAVQPAGADNAAASPQSSPQKSEAPAKQRRRAQIVTESGSQFEKPAELELPEWLRVAQQNPTPSGLRRPAAPHVQAAPAPQQEQQQRPAYGYAPQASQPVRQADLYAAAGYPPQLLEEQRRLDALEEAQRLRRRKGAMSVLPEEAPARPAATGSSYPPPRQPLPQRKPLTPAEQAARQAAAERIKTAVQPPHESPYTITAEEPAPGEERRSRFPWLGALAAVLVLAAVFIWLNRITTGQELEKVYHARQQAAQQVLDEHPYHYRELIEAQAAQYNLHPAFVASIVLNESSFRPGVKSSADAMGLMQIRPDTGTYINRALEVPGYNHDMLYEPEVNIRFGCYYLGELSSRFAGDPVLVAAAYNAGPTNVQNWLNNSQYSADQRTIPLDSIPYGDTRTYARRIMRDFAAYKRLYYETTEDEQ